MAKVAYDAAAQHDLISKASAKRLEDQQKAEQKHLASWKAAQLEAIDAMAKAEGESDAQLLERKRKAREKLRKAEAKREQDLEKESEKRKLKEEQRTKDILARYESNLLKSGDKEQRLSVRKSQIDRLETFQKEYSVRSNQLKVLATTEQQLQAELSAATKKADKQRIQQQIADLKQKQSIEENWIENNKEKYAASFSDIANTKISNVKDTIASGDPEAMKQAAKDLQDVAKDQTLAESVRQAAFHASLDAENAARKEEARQKNEAIKAELKYRLTTLDGIKDTIADGLMKMTSGLSKMFDSLEAPINSFYEYQAKYEARMQGSGNDYGKMMSNVGFTIGMSPFLKQTKMVENLQKLIDTGTNYNLELRAYIATVSESIASTFDAFDSNLLRLIRIQQNDSTAARLGMEAALTEMLNKMYKDSSYLSEGGPADQVTAALLEASAQLSHQGAAEMEFVAQKWLGSLYSLGVGSDTVQAIATGLGYIGSGNIDALSGNESLMSLMTMGAAKSGKSITELMTGGLTADKTNELLRGITEYLSEIASNTDSNNVTKSAMAQIFGVTNTDLRSISNLTSADFDTIYNSNLNYSQALAEASSQLKQISNRTHISQIVSNIMENATTSSALMIGSNAVTYSMYKALNVVSGLVGDRGLEIPGIQALGTGTASGIDVLSVAKAAIAGGGLLASLIGSLGNMGSGGLPSLSKWEGYEKSLERGTGFKLNDYGIESGFSENVVYNNKGSGSVDDLSAAGMNESNERARDNQSSEDQAVADDAAIFYKDGMQRLNDIVDFINELEAETKAIPVKLVEVDAATQLTLARLMKAGLFTDLSSADSALGLTTEGQNIDIFDALQNKLNGLKVEITNEAFNPVPVTLGLGGM